MTPPRKTLMSKGSEEPDPQDGTLNGEKLADRVGKEEPDTDQKEE